MKNPDKILLDPRAYRDTSDLVKMGALLRAGSAAANGAFYAHPGDIYWGCYYPEFGGEAWPYYSLWDDRSDLDRLLAWSLIDPNWGTFDVYVQPELRATLLAEAIYIWAEELIAGLIRAGGKDTIRANYIADQDDIVIARLQGRGFQRTQADTVCMTQSLDYSLPRPALPEGYIVRGSKGEDEVITRATAQYNAFTNTVPFDWYVERFRRFGLGKAVMIEALRRLKARGMTRARVSTLANNIPGIKLYEAAGFHIAQRLGAYEKKLVP